MSTTTDITDIDSPVAKPDAKAPGKKPAATKAAPAEGRHTVTIHPSADSDGMAPVKVGVNGTLYLIPRNTPCDLPEEVIEVLRNAVYTDWREVDGVFQPHERQRFSFSLT